MDAGTNVEQFTTLHVTKGGPQPAPALAMCLLLVCRCLCAAAGMAPFCETPHRARRRAQDRETSRIHVSPRAPAFLEATKWVRQRALFWLAAGGPSLSACPILLGPPLDPHASDRLGVCRHGSINGRVGDRYMTKGACEEKLQIGSNDDTFRLCHTEVSRAVFDAQLVASMRQYMDPGLTGRGCQGHPVRGCPDLVA